MADHSRPRSRRAGVLVIGLFAAAMAELAAAIAAALAGDTSWANAVGSFTVTNGAMGLGFAACGALLAWRWLIWVAAVVGLLFVLSFGGPGRLDRLMAV